MAIAANNNRIVGLNGGSEPNKQFLSKFKKYQNYQKPEI